MEGGDQVNVAIVLMKYNPFGGYERQAAILARALAKRGDRVTIVAGSFEGAPEEGMEVIKAPVIRLSSWLKVLSFALSSRSVISRRPGGFDIVIAFDRTLVADIYRAGNACHREWLAFRSAHFGLRDRLSILINPLHAVVNGLEKRLLRNLRERGGRIVVLSDRGRDEICRHHGLERDLFTVIPPAVDLDRIGFSAAEAGKGPARKALGIPNQIPVILHVGSGFRIKGLESTIKALAALKRDGREALLIAAGKDRSGTKRLGSLARSLGVSGNIVFPGGVKEVGALYDASDVFVLPSLFETFGTAAIEALAAGLPVVIGRGAGAASFIEKERAGKVIQTPADPDELAGLIQEALSTDCTLRRIGGLARERARRREAALKCSAQEVTAVFASLMDEIALSRRTLNEASLQAGLA
ncbi:MAG: glycosyltransferase family 4 protein [Deltaproteobacteria bacterium]|nr:glycosyltransferase family 4 protein [Deltaproteobacteria bacterium]MCL4874852.1 glycosyltransferase family 4 protein [bacterium]